MDAILLSIHPNDPLWIAIAFLFGLVVKMIGLPPLLGYLVAGFLLHALGAESDQFLSTIADLGITLLLFSIGLKLRPRSLARAEVWGVTMIHMVTVTGFFAGFVLLLTQFDFLLFTNLDLKSALLIGFVLSFSSTIFAIKILDDLGAMSSMHGQVSIGVLVMQDIAAVVFLAVSVGYIPSPWAILLFLLIPLRPLFHAILDKTGHGELLVLFGIMLALAGADIFELVGIKGDVGALVFGMLLASHAKASELAKSLLSFKDLFLVGFFLSVGMTAPPGWMELFVALIFLVVLPLKAALFFGLFNLFRLRASTSWRASLNLANYSEFGLIVGALVVSSGWLPNEWVAVFAFVLSLSFIASAPVIGIRDSVYQRWRHGFKYFERKKRISEEADIDLTTTKIIIFGMGRMGFSAYSALEEEYGEQIVGVEIDPDKTLKHQALGRNVVRGDATNPDFWTKAKGMLDGLNAVMLTLPTHAANLAAAQQLKDMGYQGFIAATSKFDDEELSLKLAGVNHTFNIYTEAGHGFANDLKKLVN